MTDRSLIFDIGMHEGQDSEFYLKKGFKVVGVEADAELCSQAASRFADAVRDERLVIVNTAVAATVGELTFYRCPERTEWSTIEPTKAPRGYALDAVTVTSTTLEALMARFGTPYFVKIDIEGADMAAIQGLPREGELPRFISVEVDSGGVNMVRKQVRSLTDMGYSQFAISPQLDVPKRRAPRPPREGADVEHRFETGSSGLFGEELPARWMGPEEIVEAFRPIVLRYCLTGGDSLVRSRTLRRVLKRVGFRAGWHDLHARRS